MSAWPRDRLHVLLLVAAGAFLLVAARLFHLQVVEADFWKREALKARTTTRAVPFERGWILARDMAPLAFTEKVYDLQFIYGNFRKESAVGQIGMIYQLLNGRRPDLTQVYADPTPYVEEIFDLTLDRAAAPADALQREDLLFYLQRLLDPTGEAGVFSEGGAPRDLPFRRWPALRGMADEIALRVKEEGSALAALEEELGLAPGTLLERPGAAAAQADARVRGRMGAHEEGGAYRTARRYHSQFDYYEDQVARRVPHAAVMRIVVNEDLYPGFDVVEGTRRAYPRETADLCPNLIGKVGSPSPAQLEATEAHRQRAADLALIEDKTEEEIVEAENLQVWLTEIDVLPGEEVGSFGFELLLEPVLRGKRGCALVERGPTDRFRKVTKFTPPVSGKDVVLTLDVGLQRACESALDAAGYAGAAVVMDARTGAVLALATSPRPDRRGLSESYGELVNQPSRPLLQRAFGGWDLPPPGSVFKLVTAVAALEDRRVDPGERYLCERRLAVGDATMKCEGHHGAVDLTEALVESCNIYFYQLARQSLDYDLMFAWARRFGFGVESGIFDGRLYGAAFEPAGLREQPGHLKIEEKGLANLMRFCIGQGAIDDATPLQVARLAAGLATGSLPQPHVIRRIGAREIPHPPPSDLGLSPDTLRFVQHAMRLVVERGTAAADPARNLDLSRYKVAGKTGTAQVANGPSHAWFAGFLPFDEPKLAFAVLVESCGLHGGQAAAPLFQRILEQEGARAVVAEAVR